MDKIVALCKNRGFVYPGSEIYGGLANSWDYGPLGRELKENIKRAWWQRFIQEEKKRSNKVSPIQKNCLDYAIAECVVFRRLPSNACLRQLLKI